MKRLATASIVLAIAGCACADFYQFDDGTSEEGLTTSGANLNCIYLTQYTIAAGGETLTSIDLTWGAKSATTIPNGMAVQVLLMSDPNQDGNPGDSQVLQAINTTTANVGSDTFNNYALTPTTMSDGTSFFVGAYVPNMPTGDTWNSIDTEATGKGAVNWWTPFGSPGSASYSQLSIFGANLTFLVRVNASPVPEPASMCVLGLGIAALIRRKRRVQR